jgi:hypothetical protein
MGGEREVLQREGERKASNKGGKRVARDARAGSTNNISAIPMKEVAETSKENLHHTYMTSQS